VTRRGKLALVLAALTYLAAWAFGSRALYPVAVGLGLAAIGAWLWVAVSARPVRLERIPRGGRHYEGQDVVVDLRLDVDGRVPPPPTRVVESLARLGERETELEGRTRTRYARYTLHALPRGRYAVERATAVVEDPFGLARRETAVDVAGALLVYPHHVELDRLFSERGLREPGGRKLLLHRAAGYDLHHVREYAQGESLRRVHWPTTARRSRLMVKELQDAPRDEVAVVLDADGAAQSEESFDLCVRAAASIVHAHARRAKRTMLVVTGRRQETVEVSSSGADWQGALDLLASASPDGRRPLSTVLADDSSSAARALELAVVTASVSRALADRLVQRSQAHRRASLVYVERRPGHPAEADLLRVQAAGVPVAVLREGDDLAAVLGAWREAAYG
jgi:uncharacterized protein (DUF58 family)